MHFVWIATDRIPCALIYLIISVCCRVRVSVSVCVRFIELEFHLWHKWHHYDLFWIYAYENSTSSNWWHFCFFNENSISMVFAIQSYFILICATSITILFIHRLTSFFCRYSSAPLLWPCTEACIRFPKKKFKNIRKEKCRLALIGQQCVHLCTNVETRVHSKEQRPIFIYWCCWMNVNY